MRELRLADLENVSITLEMISVALTIHYFQLCTPKVHYGRWGRLSRSVYTVLRVRAAMTSIALVDI